MRINRSVVLSFLLILCLLMSAASTALAEGGEARIGSTEYFDLQDAINAAGSQSTITVLCDVTLTDGLEIASGKRLSIDLNGHTISYPSAEETGNAAITNYGDLTILDSAGGGKITYQSSNPSGSFAYATNAVSNYSRLTLNGGAIENTTVGGASYGVDNLSVVDNTGLIVNGGSITAAGDGIRSFASNPAYMNKVEINGGEVTGRFGYLIQLPGSNDADAPMVDVDITGGKLTATGTNELALYSYSYGNSYYNVDINITDGQFVGDVAVGGGTANGGTGVEKVRVSGGNFSSTVFNYGPTNGNILLSGGLYGIPPYAEDYVGDNTVITVASDPSASDAIVLIGSDVTPLTLQDGGYLGICQQGKQPLSIGGRNITVLNDTVAPETAESVVINGRVYPLLAGETMILNPYTDEVAEEEAPPRTGDSTPIALWLMLMALAAAGMVLTRKSCKQR